MISAKVSNNVNCVFFRTSGESLVRLDQIAFRISYILYEIVDQVSQLLVNPR